MNRAILGLSLFLSVAFVVLATKPNELQTLEPKQSKRNIASVRKVSATPEIRYMIEGMEKPKADSDSKEADKASVDEVEERWKATSAKIRKKLPTETLEWSQKFPVPQNRNEDRLLLLLQFSHYKRASWVVANLNNSSITDWNNADPSFDNYIEACLNRVNYRDEHFERNSLQKFIYMFRGSSDFSKYLSEDIDIYLEDPLSYPPELHEDLANYVTRSEYIENEDKTEIVEEIQRRRYEE